MTQLWIWIQNLPILRPDTLHKATKLVLFEFIKLWNEIKIQTFDVFLLFFTFLFISCLLKSLSINQSINPSIKKKRNNAEKKCRLQKEKLTCSMVFQRYVRVFNSIVHGWSFQTSCITYCSEYPGGKIFFAMEAGLKSVCNHFFTKAADQPSESASRKTK